MASVIRKYLVVILLTVIAGGVSPDAPAQDVLKSLPALKGTPKPEAEETDKAEEGKPAATTQKGATQPSTQASTQPAGVPKGLASPRATMATFLEGMAQMESRDVKAATAAWNKVMSTLDASGLKEPETLRSRAEELRSVLDRLGEVKPGDLPGDTEVEQTSAVRFRYFPRQPEHAWVWKELKAFQKSPDGSITLTRDDVGAWRFSAKTVAGIDNLYKSLKDLPPRSGSAEIMGLLGPTFAQTSWLGWLVLLGGIFAGLVVGRLAQAGLVALGKRAASREHKARAVALDNTAGPASFAFLTAGLYFGMQFIYMEPDVHEFSGRTIQFLAILAIGWLLYNLVEMIEIAIRQFTDKTKNQLDDMVVPLIRKALRVFLVVIFTLFVAQNVFGWNITSWLAGLGIAGLAVSLAAQDSVKNLFGSMTVFFDKPFGVGDWIKFEGFDGTVEEIGFRSSRVRTLSGHLVTVPNMKFIDSSVENMSARPFIRRTLNVMITYDMPPEKVEEAVSIVKAILSEPPISEGFDMEKRAAHVAFDDFRVDSLNIKVDYWYILGEGRDYWTYLAHAQEFNLRLLKRFGEAGIKFAFPKQTPYEPPAGEKKPG